MKFNLMKSIQIKFKKLIKSDKILEMHKIGMLGFYYSKKTASKFNYL